MRAWLSRGGVPLVVLLLIALVVRLAAIGATSDYSPLNDAGDYHRHAISLAAGHGYPESSLVDGGPSAARTPAYPFFLGGIYALTGNSVTAGRIANALLGVLVVLLIYLLAAQMWGCRIAAISAALAAVFPPFVFLSLSLLSETLGLVFALGTVLALLRYCDSAGQLRYAALAGLLAGLVALSRANGLLVIGLAIAAVLLSARPLPRSLAPAVAAAVAVVCVIAPWTARNIAVFDRPVFISNHAAALAGTYNDVARTSSDHAGGYHGISFLPQLAPVLRRSGLNEAEAAAELRERAVDYAVNHPTYVLEASALNTLRLFEVIPLRGRFREGQLSERGIGDGAKADVLRPAALVLLALSLVGAALLVSRAAGLPSGPWFVWLLPALIVASTVPVDGRPRYRIFVDPFLILLASVTLVWAWDRVRGRGRLVEAGAPAI